MRPKVTKWLILACLLAYAVIVSAWADSVVRSRKCTGIDIDIRQGAPDAPQFLKPEAVKNELGILASTITSRSLYDIDTDSLERHLNTLNNFEHVEVVRTSSGRLLISVLPLIPEARVFTPTATYYINKDGKRMGAGAEYHVDLPIVHGNFTDRMPASGVLPVVRYLRENQLMGALITMIDYRSPKNIMLIPRIRGHIINLGDTNDLPEKFEKLALMYRKVLPHVGWNMYDTISLKFKGQIVATRADKRVRKHSNVDLSEIDDPEESALPSASEELETEAIHQQDNQPPAGNNSGGPKAKTDKKAADKKPAA